MGEDSEPNESAELDPDPDSDFDPDVCFAPQPADVETAYVNFCLMMRFFWKELNFYQDRPLN